VKPGLRIPLSLLPLVTLLIVALFVPTGAAAQVVSERAEAFGNTPDSTQPITVRQRFDWFTHSTIGPESLAGGMFTAAFGTAIDRPREYGPHWEGFGKRYGMRFTGIATGNAMEATIGSFWGEDPRYFRAGSGQPFRGRLKNVVVMTFMARRADGNAAPAYARYIGISGNNFLSNTWRADSESGVSDACLRTALGFAGRMGGNAFAEFWPTLTQQLFHRNHP
jgi:hypothetical protein